MRISDWSSDVCSSDLIVLRQRTAPTQLVEYPTKTIAERIEHHHLIWTERPGKLRHPAKRQNRRRAKPRRPASIRCPLLGAMDLSGYQAANRRSEEHTSELQSLMRISYAVFCLKKKKRTSKVRITKQK